MNSPTLLYMFIIIATVDALPSAEIMQEIKDTVQDEIAIEIVEPDVPQCFFIRDTVDTDIDICLECPIDVKCIASTTHHVSGVVPGKCIKWTRNP